MVKGVHGRLFVAVVIAVIVGQIMRGQGFGACSRGFQVVLYVCILLDLDFDYESKETKI